MTRSQVQTKIRKSLQKLGLEKIQEILAQEFYDMEDVIEVLYRSVIAGKNIVLFGLGGFGKTQIVKRFLEVASIQQATIVGFEDMDVEALLGIPDMEKLLKESIYQIAFDTTAFMTPGIMVLEEFFDVNPKTAIALKDIMTEGGYRQGNDFTESKISSYIICTNKSPQEMNIDNSTVAFYHERFPVKKEVKWPDYSYVRYIYLIQLLVSTEEFKQYEEHYKVLAELCYRTSTSLRPVSPRIVKDALDLLKYNEYDILALKLLDGIDTSMLPQVEEACRLRDEASRVKEVEEDVTTTITDILADKEEKNITGNLSKLSYIKERLRTYQITDEKNVPTINHLRDMCERAQEALWKFFNNVSVVDKDSIDEIFK